MFRAGETVELVMPCSEALLHAELAGKAMLLVVTEHDFQERQWVRLYWVSRTTGARLPTGYTLAECGIRVVEGGYEGQAPRADDPSPAAVQRQAREIAAQLAAALGGASAVIWED